MVNRFISRRRFLESSLSGGLAVGLGLTADPRNGSVSARPLGTDGLTLKVTGDAQLGYGVALFFQGPPVARHNLGGEFSAVFQNEERSVEDRINNWKAASWIGDATHVRLDGECKLKNLNATVFVRVEYERITPNVVRKRIRLRQADMFLLFYQLSNRLEPLETPRKLWSFDQLDFRGGRCMNTFQPRGSAQKMDSASAC